MARKTEQVTIGRRQIEVSNLDKLLYPGGKFTKANVIDYYITISKYLLPHLKNRPVTLKRTPDWVKTVPVPRRETPGPDIQYILINECRDFQASCVAISGSNVCKRRSTVAQLCRRTRTSEIFKRLLSRNRL